MTLSPDIKGDADEGLLKRNAQNTQFGACQYFTPRPMIDPACGTGDFLIVMFLAIVEHCAEMTREQRDHLRHHALHGSDIVLR
ncbi:hypothetical protein [Vulcanococcus limneticus]|uniref:hypothetical protein n=1 Tax=Vulcanococcus limneticus TaxID=2170428 RepID=UPI00398BD1F1